MSSTLKRAGGGMGLATAFVAFYTGIAGILTPETSYFVLPVGDLSGKAKVKSS
jgi:succinate-acetate transporter protein